MRVLSRFALVAVLLLAAPAVFADHLLAECPLSLVASNPGATNFNLSPHGVFRSGSQVFVLRGQTLTTFVTNDVGDLTVGREDFIGSLGARETNGGVTFANGYLFVSSEAGLEIYDLRNVRPGGNAPILVSRSPNLHYRRLAVSGNTLAGLYPATDLPCIANGSASCYNTIDIYNISNLLSPVRTATISSIGVVLGFNDVAMNFNFLVATGYGVTYSYNISNPSDPFLVGIAAAGGTFLVSNGSNLVGVGNEGSIGVYSFSSSGLFNGFALYGWEPSLAIDRSNPLMFHPQAWFDDSNARLITMVDEKDPQTLLPARTIAFDVFDFTVPGFDGSDPRLYEQVTFVSPNEVKWNPVSVGTYVYTVGELSGLQSWGSCAVAAGQIEWDGTSALPCGGTELHGWVTGSQKTANVELFLDSGSLGAATIGGVPRSDISAKTPVFTWRINVNLDNTTRGDHILRAIGTDSNGNRRQFASQRVFFNGPGQNCVVRRRHSADH
jgi:hypothetical protein